MSENEKKRIKDAIDSIEPAEGAKERMLANIMAKAAEQTKKESSPENANMEQKTSVIKFNRIMRWVLPLAACCALVLIGGIVVPGIVKDHNSKIGGDNVQIPNPLVSVDDAGVFEEKLGIKTDAPAEATDTEYLIIDGRIADIRFSMGQHAYILRASKSNDDFSGLYGKETDMGKLDKDATLTKISSGEQEWFKITWKEGKINFVLTNTDGASEEDIKAVFSKIQ